MYFGVGCVLVYGEIRCIVRVALRHTDQVVQYATFGVGACPVTKSPLSAVPSASRKDDVKVCVSLGVLVVYICHVLHYK